MQRRELLRSVVLGAVLLGATPAIAVAQTSTPSVAALTVSGDVTTPLRLTAADLKSMPRKKVDVKTDTGPMTFEGVLVGDILQKAGAPTGKDMRGSSLATYVVATATDGYQIVFSLGELENDLSKNDIIVADMADGKPIAAAQGPFRIVVPKDERAARGVRNVEKLEVVRLKK